jgi:hypothetical protein
MLTEARHQPTINQAGSHRLDNLKPNQAVGFPKVLAEFR